MSFPFYKQLDAMDCGPSCLRMIAKHYGKTYSLQSLREKSFITREGVSLLGISDAAENIGFRTCCCDYFGLNPATHSGVNQASDSGAN